MSMRVLARRMLKKETVPPRLQIIEVRCILKTFSGAFNQKAPSVYGSSAKQALDLMICHTARQMEEAQQSGRAAEYRARLGEESQKLGRFLRRLLDVKPHEAFDVLAYVYRGIGIHITGSLPGSLVFNECSCAVRYSEEDCWFMAAFDEGFMRGLLGDGTLTFEQRITQGAPCCKACFKER